MKRSMILFFAIALVGACNNEADSEVSTDSLTNAPLDNSDVNNRNATMYDSTNKRLDTASYERSSSKVNDSMQH